MKIENSTDKNISGRGRERAEATVESKTKREEKRIKLVDSM